MKIGLFYGLDNICYGTLNFFTLQIEETLKKYGIQTERITSLDDSIISKQYDAFIGFNLTLPAIQLENGTYVMDYFQCPFFNIIVDPPYYHHNSLKSHMDNLYCIFLDEGHVEYCNQYYPPCKNVEMGFLLGPVGDVVPYENRENDVLFTGGLYGFEEIKEEYIKELNNEMFQKIFIYLIESGIKFPDKSTPELVKRWIEYHNWEINNDSFNTLMGTIGLKAEYYLRGYYREKVVRTLVENGIKVHVAGSGWEKLSVKKEYQDNLIQLGNFDMKQTGELTAKSKILLNVMPWFKNGLHDRIPTAMHNKAICVTDSSTYIDSHFQDMENIVLYDLKEIEKLPEKIKWLLKNPDEAKKIVDAGYKKVSLEYTWDKIVMDNILKWLW